MALTLPPNWSLYMASQLKKPNMDGVRSIPAETKLGDFWVQFQNIHDYEIIGGRGVTIEEAWSRATLTAACHSTA